MSSDFVPNLDITKPSPARMYDYALGGSNNFEIDRLAVQRGLSIYPDTLLVPRANRAFLRRAVTFMAQQGIDQFLDIGSGIPGVGNVHDLVADANPDAHVVYVDIDPIAVSYGQELLHDNPNAVMLFGDVYQPEQILANPAIQKLIDFSRPVGLLLVTTMHYVTKDDVALQTMQTLRNALARGSHLALSHVCYEGVPASVIEILERMAAASTNPVKARTREDILAMIEGWELVEPGLVPLPLWRPEGPDDILIDEPHRAAIMAGVGILPKGAV